MLDKLTKYFNTHPLLSLSYILLAIFAFILLILILPLYIVYIIEFILLICWFALFCILIYKSNNEDNKN